MSTFDLSPKTKSETQKTRILDAAVFEKSVFCVSDLVFGRRSKVNILFYSNFNKEQNDH